MVSGDFPTRGVNPSGLALRRTDAMFQAKAEPRDPQTSPHDLRAEAIARQRGMSEDEIAMIKAGLEDIEAGRVVDQEEMFARLKVKYAG